MFDRKLAGAASYGCARSKGLQAAVVATGAAGPCSLDGYVSEFTARALRAAHQDTVRDDPAPDPCSERDEDQVIGLTPNPEPELTPRRGVAVVLYRKRHPDPRLELILQGDALDRAQVR